MAHVRTDSQNATFDAAGNPVTVQFDTQSLTYLRLYVAWNGSGGHSDMQFAPTVNGISASSLGAVVVQGNVRVRAYELVSPAQGAAIDVVVDPVSGAGTVACTVTMMGFDGVAPTTPSDGFVSNVGTATPASVTVTSEAGDTPVFYVAVLTGFGPTGLTPTNYTEREDHINGVWIVGGGEGVGAASIAFSAAISAGSISGWVAIGGNLNASASVDAQPGTGSLEIEGFAPAVEASNPPAPSVPATDVFVFAVSGTPNDILLRDTSAPAPPAGAALVTVPTGVLALNGQVPEFLTTGLVIVTPPVGVLTLVTPHTADTTMITADTITVTADRSTHLNAPTVLVGPAPQPDVGQLALDGFAPTVTVGANVSVEPAVGALDLTGLAPTVETPVNVTPDTGALVVAGLEPTVQTPVNVAPAVGALDLAGLEPIVIVGTNDVVVAPDTGALALTGLEPTIATPVSVTPDVGALVFTGFEPTVEIVGAADVFPGVGELEFTGYAPAAEIRSLTGGGVAEAPPLAWRRRVLQSRQTANPQQTEQLPVRRR
jgi:hypothetical protein